MLDLPYFLYKTWNISKILHHTKHFTTFVAKKYKCFKKLKRLDVKMIKTLLQLFLVFLVYYWPKPFFKERKKSTEKTLDIQHLLTHLDQKQQSGGIQVVMATAHEGGWRCEFSSPLSVFRFSVFIEKWEMQVLHLQIKSNSYVRKSLFWICIQS